MQQQLHRLVTEHLEAVFCPGWRDAAALSSGQGGDEVFVYGGVVDHDRIELRLYVSGEGSLATLARSQVQALCERMGTTCDVEIVDVLDAPDVAEDRGILATPTLERLAPPPVLRVVGDLADLETAMDGLGLRVWQVTGGDGHAQGSP
ncbi:MAG: circadian clock KaiB family protein [Nitriliruptorales bacterium]|nr:circadian clock KaiB family protein [Nitriliruptorales bacterium]